MRERMSIHFKTTYRDILAVGPDMIPGHLSRYLPKDVVLAWHFARHRHGTRLEAQLTNRGPSGQMAVDNVRAEYLSL